MDVLVVEDSAAVRAGITAVLLKAGLSVTAVENGLAALSELDRRRFRAIVSDIRMPFLDGPRLYAHILEEHPYAARRVIFVTAWVDDPEIGRFLQLAGRPILQKPFDLDELVALVRQVAGRPSVAAGMRPPIDEDHRARARSLADDYGALTGSPESRVRDLLWRHWRSAPERDLRQLEDAVLVILDPVVQGRPATEAVRRATEEAVTQWLSGLALRGISIPA